MDDQDDTDTATLGTNKHAHNPNSERYVGGLLLIPELQRELLGRNILQLEVRWKE